MEDNSQQLDEDESQRFEWCLVGNIVGERPYGVGGIEVRSGTKHFTTGTKVYCLPMWDDEQILSLADIVA